MVAELRDLTNEEYHADTSSNSHSMLDVFIKNPELYAGQFVYGSIERKQTAAMAFGSAVHEIVLETDALMVGLIPLNGKSYCHVPPECLGKGGARSTNAYKDFSAGVPDGMAILDDADFGCIAGMLDSIKSNSSAVKLLAGSGKNEQSIFWQDPHSGLDLKARVDRITDSFIADLKTCLSADPKQFAKSAFEYGYHRQAAMYGDAVQALTGHDLPMVFIAVEKEPPYTCNVFELDFKFVALGGEHNREALGRLADCKLSGKWRGPHGDRIITIAAPNWAWSDAEWRAT